MYKCNNILLNYLEKKKKELEKRSRESFLVEFKTKTNINLKKCFELLFKQQDQSKNKKFK
jgi:hypothetical protein